MGWTVDARVEAMARAARPAMGGWATGASRGLLGKPCCVRGGALRGGVCRLVADGSEQFVAGGIDCAGGVEVALGIGDGIELLEGDAGFDSSSTVGNHNLL